MNVNETKQILGMVATGWTKFAYPFFKQDGVTFTITGAFWSRGIIDLEFSKTIRAVEAMVKTLKYTPAVADIREKYVELYSMASVSEEEAWGMTLEAIRNFGAVYSSERAMQALPVCVRKAVRSVGGLRAIAMTDEVSLGYIRGQFIKAMKSINDDIQKRAMYGEDFCSEVDKVRLSDGVGQNRLAIESDEVENMDYDFDRVEDDEWDGTWKEKTDEQIAYNSMRCRELIAMAEKALKEQQLRDRENKVRSF